MRVRGHRKLELGKTLFLLPNLITLSSIFCGFDAIRLAARATAEDTYRAAILVVFAMVFDMLDGRVARMTKTQSAFGVQIDSLADVVSFGVAPAVLVYGWASPFYPTAALFLSFLFVACGAIRLARFNVLTTSDRGVPQKPGKYIVGLPIPGAAGIIVALVVTHHALAPQFTLEAWARPILAVTAGLSFLMVSTIPFRSFKDIKLNVQTVAVAAFALGSSGLIGARLKPAFVLLWLLGFYICLGILEAVWEFSRRARRGHRAPDSVPPPHL